MSEPKSILCPKELSSLPTTLNLELLILVVCSTMKFVAAYNFRPLRFYISGKPFGEECTRDCI
jgi:hypothetical protein